jgi:hypothetical protein
MPAKIQKVLRKYPRLGPLAGAAVIMVGGIATFWLLTRNHFAPGTLPVGAQAIPQDALMVVSTATDPAQWQRLRQFGTTKSQTEFDGMIAQWRDRLFTSNGINYETDIQPWVGPSVTLATLSPQSELTAPGSAGLPAVISPQPVIVVLPIGNPFKAKELLEQPKTSPGRTWTERKYKDVAIREAITPAGKNSQPAQALEVAVLDNKLVVVTNSPKSIEAAIDTYKGGKSLADVPGYAEALGQIQTSGQQPFVSFYYNLPASTNATAEIQQPSQTTLDWVKQSQGWATVAMLGSDGIQFNNIFWLRPDSKRQFLVKNAAKGTPSRLPAETFLMTSGGDLKQFWQDYQRDFATYPVKVFDPAVFQKEIAGSVGMDWEADFLPWMQGEFSLAMVPAPVGSAPTAPVGLVFMVQSSDRRAAETALKRLDDAMTTKFKAEIKESNLNNQPVINWNLPGSTANITRGWLDGNVAFISFVAPIPPTFFPRPQNALSANPVFQQAVPTQPDKGQDGSFFVNVTEMAKYKSLPLLQFPATAQTWLEAVRSVGVTAITSSDRTTRYDVKVMLQKGAAPGPLPSPGAIPSPSPSPKS